MVSETIFSLYTHLARAGTDHAPRVEETSLKSKSMQPASPELVEGQEGLLAQDSEATKGKEENKVPSFPTDKLDTPEGSVLNPAQPPFNGYEASAPTELAETGHGNSYECVPAILSDNGHPQAPETRTISARKLGSEEPAPYHMDAAAELMDGEDEHRAGESNWKQMASLFVHLIQ